MSSKNKAAARRNRNEQKREARMVKETRKAVLLSLGADIPGLAKGNLGFSYSDANVAAPVATSKIMRTVGPVFKQGGKGNVRIRRKEYVGDATRDAVFGVTGFPINPGLVASFPWLSGIANKYEKYKFHQVRFSFETQCPTTLAGSILLAAEYDVHDDPPQNKQEFMSMEGATRSPPWMSTSFDMDRSQLTQSQRLVRDSDPPGAADQSLYDVGIFYFGNAGIPSGDGIENLGELYVEYDIELFVPQLNTISDTSILQSVTIHSTGDVLCTPSSEKLGDLPVTVGVNTVTLPLAGEYLFVYLYKGSSLSGSEIDPSGGGITLTDVESAGDTMKRMGTFGVQSLGPKGIVDMEVDWPSSPGTISSCKILITRCAAVCAQSFADD